MSLEGKIVRSLGNTHRFDKGTLLRVGKPVDGVPAHICLYSVTRLDGGMMPGPNGFELVRQHSLTSDEFVVHDAMALTEEQRRALRMFATEQGRSWKLALARQWSNAKGNPILHALRNSHGPSWLARLRRSDFA